MVENTSLLHCPPFVVAETAEGSQAVFGRFPSVMQHRRDFFSAAVKFRLAEVNKVCYYELARYILAIETRAFPLGSGFVFPSVTHELSIAFPNVTVKAKVCPKETLATYTKTESVFMRFYDKYIRLCNSINKSPSAVAIDLEIGKPSVTRWKRGAEPRDSTKLRVANYFGITVEELMSGVEGAKKAPTEISERESISPAKQALLDVIDSLTDEQCEKLLIVVESAKKLL